MAISPDFYVSALFKLKRIQILSPAQRRGGIVFFCFFFAAPFVAPPFLIRGFAWEEVLVRAPDGANIDFDSSLE